MSKIFLAHSHFFVGDGPHSLDDYHKVCVEPTDQDTFTTDILEFYKEAEDGQYFYEGEITDITSPSDNPGEVYLDAGEVLTPLEIHIISAYRRD